MRIVLISLLMASLTACDKGSDVASGKTENLADEVVAAVEDKMPRAKVFEYGIYEPRRKGRVLDDMSTNTGKVLRRPVLEHSKTTDRIPLVKDTYFAYRYRVMDLPKDVAKKTTVELRKVLIHPEMSLPDGSTIDGWDRKVRGRTSVGKVVAFDGYAFNEGYELVEGDWVFQIWYEDIKLVEQTFTTYHPEKSDDLSVGTGSQESEA